MLLQRDAHTACLPFAAGDWRENWSWNKHLVYDVGQLFKGEYDVKK